MQSGMNEGESQHLEVRTSNPWVIPKEKTTLFKGGPKYLTSKSYSFYLNFLGWYNISS